VGVTATGTAPVILTAPPATGGNTLALVVDAGPGGTAELINVPFVTVTVCTPGTSSGMAACQSIDHVMLDTGSTGLRLLQSALSANLTLPAVTGAGGQALGECAQFADGFLWGSVRKADVYLGGEVAASVSIQDIHDQPGGATGVPSDCSATGGPNLTPDGLASELGARGILGVGLFANDCDICLSHAVSAGYYLCSSSGCANTAVSSAQMVMNPVALFALDNNGVVVSLPAVTDSTASLSGTLIFGIGTQPNNALGSAVPYATDANGDFTTTYTSVSGGAPATITAFIDSGSNGIFFNDSGIATCRFSSDFYCPSRPPTSTSPLTRTATNTAAIGGAATTIAFRLIDVDSLPTSVVAANVGGPVGFPSVFDWGLPFFYGRPVFTSMSGAPVGNGPYVAY
jgi:hypothetical protein